MATSPDREIVASQPKLLVLTPSADRYGADRALLLALPSLVAKFDVTIVFASHGVVTAEAADLGARVVVSPDWALRRSGLNLVALATTMVAVVRTMWTLRRLHRTERFVAVYANTVANALLPLVKRVVPAPLIVHVREVPRDRQRLARTLFWLVDRVADRVLCNSAFTASLIESLRPSIRDRIHVVPDGVEPMDQLEPVEDDGVLDIVCVGRIHPKKGQGHLIEAARGAVEDGHDWRLHFWGDALPEHAPLERSLREQVAAAGLADRTTWHGFESDIRAMYCGMDVAVVPSVFPEEFSLVTAEAQVVGLPVVATGPGGPSDIIVDGETGRIVPPCQPDALRRALAELEDPERRRSWGAAGRTRTLERFTVQRYAPAVVRVVVDAAAAGSHGTRRRSKRRTA